MRKKPAVEPIRIYKFGPVNEGSASMKDALGGKGANLAEMVSHGIPVPPGFTVPTSASTRFQQVKNLPARLDEFMEQVWASVADGLLYLTADFGYTPLLSVRSGARVSMPGMMDTILNVGLTTETLPFWIQKLGKRTALDSYRRLIQMYASVAMDRDMHDFEEVLSKAKSAAGVTLDSQLDEKALEKLIARYKDIAGPAFPDTLEGQLKGAMQAVFESWMNPRAIEYRAIHGYPEEWGTAVTVQAMVFGNLNDKSGTGVMFTRDPNTGEQKLYGDFLINGQGEDVVAGIRDPDLKVSEIGKWSAATMQELKDVAQKLETMFKDMQDVEFTVQDGKLFLLQTRAGKRSALASFVVARDLAVAGIITKSEAVKRINVDTLLATMTDQVSPEFKEAADLTGIPAGGGVVRGRAVFTAHDAIKAEEPTILVAKETDPEDVAGMRAAVGILTQTGGITSHAAVVARGWDKTCVVGCTSMDIAKLKAKAVCYLTIDGARGYVWINKNVPLVKAGANAAVKELCSWGVGSNTVERVEFPQSPEPKQVRDIAANLTGEVYIDTCLLEGGQVKTYDNLIALGEGLLKAKVTRIYIDLSVMASHFGKSDRMMDWMFGLNIASTPFDVVDNKVNAISQWPKEVTQKVIARNTESLLIAGGLKKLKDKGMKVYGIAATFSDLLNADGPVDADEATYANFGGKEAFQKAVAMVQQATGKELTGAAPTPIYWYEFLNYQPKEAA